MDPYVDVIEAPAHLFKSDPRMRTPDDPPTYRTVVLPNVEALRQDPPDAGTMETLLTCFDEADAEQRNLWPGQSRFATRKLVATKGPERAATELVSYALARLSNRHGRVVEPLTKLRHQVVAMPSAPPVLVGKNVVAPPVVLVRNRLVLDWATLPLVPPRVLDAALLQLALGLFMRANQQVELLGSYGWINGKPVKRAPLLAATTAQIQDMMAKLGVPQVFGTVYGYHELSAVPEVLHFAVDHDVSFDVRWDERFPDVYAKVFDRVPDDPECDQGSSDTFTPPAGGTSARSQDADDESGDGTAGSNAHEQSQSDQPSRSDQSSQSDQSDQSDQSEGEGQSRPMAASMMDQATADQLFGESGAASGDITPSDAERAEIARDMMQKFVGTEPMSLLRQLAALPTRSEPTLGEIVRQWAEEVSSRTASDQLSPLRHSDPVWRRYGYWQPSQATPKLGDIAVVLDTSGSVGLAELRELSSALQEICTVGQPTSVRIIACDTAAHDVAVLHQEHIVQLFDEQNWLDLIGDRRARIRGGGGTDMMAGITRALTPPDLPVDDEFGADGFVEPKLVVVLTDGWTPWADTPPPVPVVVATTDRPGPAWATTAKIAKV